MKSLPLVAVAIVLCITQIAETTTSLHLRNHSKNHKECVIEKITQHLKDSPEKLLIMLTLITDPHGGEQNIEILKLVINDEQAFLKIVDQMVEEKLMKNPDFLDNVWYNYLKPGVGGFIGGVFGATIGSFASPVFGTTIGGVIGGVSGWILLSPDLSDWIIENFLNLSKKEAMQNAYHVLQLDYGASMNQVDSNFERLALEHHPDKVGSYDDLLKLSLSKGYIQMSKGEWY